jgi:hypothetical protein
VEVYDQFWEGFDKEAATRHLKILRSKFPADAAKVSRKTRGFKKEFRPARPNAIPLIPQSKELAKKTRPHRRYQEKKVYQRDYMRDYYHGIKRTTKAKGDTPQWVKNWHNRSQGSSNAL